MTMTAPIKFPHKTRKGWWVCVDENGNYTNAIAFFGYMPPGDELDDAQFGAESDHNFVCSLQCCVFI